MKVHAGSSYDVRIVAFVGKDWDDFDTEEYIFQVIAEGSNHTTIAKGKGRTIEKAFADLKVKLDRKLFMDQFNG